MLQAREQGLTPGAYAHLSGDPDAPAPSALDDLQEYLDYQRYFEEYDEDDEVLRLMHAWENVCPQWGACQPAGFRAGFRDYLEP